MTKIHKTSSFCLGISQVLTNERLLNYNISWSLDLKVNSYIQRIWKKNWGKFKKIDMQWETKSNNYLF
jgi:hypothetical protein